MSAAVEWSRPRTTPMAGRRKATESWCAACSRLHRTHRHPAGEEHCPALEAAKLERRTARESFPHIRQVPRTASA